MLARIVAIPPVERDTPDDAEQAEEHERGPPADELQHPDDEERREGAAPARGHPQEALRARALGAAATS